MAREQSMTLSDPTTFQRRATLPTASIWVDASAGTGKTKVLTDRVLRLMLEGTLPHKILCLTFTKAAAAEMQQRILETLGAWATCSQEALSPRLRDLLGLDPLPSIRKRARDLFFNLLEDPYGLQVLTIHSFCQKILRRFPIEADIPVGFKVLEHSAQEILLNKAVEKFFLSSQGDFQSSQAFQFLSRFYRPETILKNLKEIILDPKTRRSLLDLPITLLEKKLAAYFGVAYFENDQKRHIHYPLKEEILKELIKVLQEGSKSEESLAGKLKPFVGLRELTPETFQEYYEIFFTAQQSPRQRFATQRLLKKYPWINDFLQQEVEALTTFREEVNRFCCWQGSYSLAMLAQKLLGFYEQLKTHEGGLEFDDLIRKASELLSKNQGLSWVLYKLDGGIDHILVDEAQDNSPEQWQIILHLAEEFFAGQGSRFLNRTLFVVGDHKQSIYSFQGAEAGLFHRLRSFFEAKVLQAKKDWCHLSLDVSFRSCEAVLTVVDHVFKKLFEPSYTLHQTFRPLDGGRVTLWPLIQNEQESPLIKSSTSQKLASLIAHTIQKRLQEKEILPSKKRSVLASDFMILVQRRGTFMYQMIRALKKQGIPVAGPDRFLLLDHVAIQDLLALGEFLLLPEDDYALACVLKSPLFNFTEEALLEIAKDRGSKSLWSSLIIHAFQNPTFKETWKTLKTLLRKAEISGPYEIFSFVLTMLKGSQLFKARLGEEVEEAFEEFLNLAITFEKTNVSSLQGFLSFCKNSSPEIKRDFSSSALEGVRVMTVHGAKGLQAPIVFLPDTTRTPPANSFLLWAFDKENKEMPLWNAPQYYTCQSAFQAKEENQKQEQEEYYRLLYVAMTRAEDELVIAGWENRRRSEDCWYSLLEKALQEIGQKEGQNYYYNSSNQEKRLVLSQSIINQNEEKGVFPPCLLKACEEKGEREPLAPSVLERLSQSAFSREALSMSSPYLEGSYAHKLLEILPSCPSHKWDTIAREYAHHLNLGDLDSLISSLYILLTDPGFKDIFTEGSYGEVPVAGTLFGQKFNAQIDRLILTPSHAHIVDFKTNRSIPDSLDQVPEAYLTQLVIYRELLKSIYPTYEITTEIIWLRKPLRMPIPPSILEALIPLVKNKIGRL